MKKFILIVLVISSQINSQNFTGGFNFYLPSTDTTTQKFLPKFPKQTIGDNDFVSIDSEGKFSVNGNRIRFWGTNSGADAAFPPKNIAGLLAGRLRKYGFNLIRLHHLDNPWSDRSLLGKTYTRELNSTYLDLLENYIAALKQNGIYINMNLHVSRTFRIFDQVANYDSLPEFGKGVNFFDPYIISLHKEYARQLLTHVNPYTGKSLVNDPVMAMVEITNENSLYRMWRDNQLKPINKGGKLPTRYSKMLDSLFNNFISQKYNSTTALQLAWSKGVKNSSSSEQIKNGSFETNTTNWILEQHSPASGTISVDNQNTFRGTGSCKVTVTNSSGIDWNIQFKQQTITLKRDSLYTVSFAIRADSPKEINVSLMNDQSPWNWYGGKSFTVGTNWDVFTFSVKASENNAGHARLSFALGKSTGSFWIDEVSVAYASVVGLKENEQIENRNIARLDYADCPGYSPQRVRDMSEFYIEVQRNYFKEMLAYLKNELGVKVPINGSNWNVGPADLASMSDADYVDNHSYWDHPSFPKEPWSSIDWTVNNTPMVKNSEGGTIPALFTGVPEVGKPFTVSEYQHPFPNQYHIESTVFSLGYSAFNDADALMYFAYDEPYEWNIDKINGYFQVNRNSILMAQFPSVSHAFRSGYIKPSVSPIELSFTRDTLYSIPGNDAANWNGYSFFDRKIGLKHAVKVKKYFSGSTSNFNTLPKVSGPIFQTDTEEIIYNTTDGMISLNTDKYIGIAGYLVNSKNIANTKLQILDLNNSDFGTVSWISLVDKPLEDSELSLITIGSKIQNTGMVWNTTNTSISNKWGSAPTQVYPLKGKVLANINADSIYVYPLDERGAIKSSLKIKLLPIAPNKFQILFDQSRDVTLWYGIEKFGDGTVSNLIGEKSLPDKFELMQNYPNPFNPETVISYVIPTGAINHKNFSSISSHRNDNVHVSLKVYDILGREVADLVNEAQSPGTYSVKFTISSSLSTGMYFYRLQAGDFVSVKKMMLMK
jgi:hypothetical protein